MKCSDVDAIINEHRARTLSGAERSALDVHLEQCGRCSGAWLTNQALLGERVAAAPPDLFAITARRARARAATDAERRARPWPSIAGLAALFLVAGVFVLFPRNSPETARGPGVNVAVDNAAEMLVEGRDYRRLAGRVPSATDGTPIEVVELFAYDCGQCYAFETRFSEWLDARRGEIALVRVPVQWSVGAERQARAFYAAETLGKADAMHLAFFDEIHTQDGALDSDAALASLFARFGVDRVVFEETLASPAVAARAGGARALARAYDVARVPTIVVGGALVTDAEMVGTERLVDVVERLVQCVEEARRATEASLARYSRYC
jgi:thiol:disulfide interchange protein DsbA